MVHCLDNQHFFVNWTRSIFECIFLCSIFQDFGDHSDQYYSVQTQEGEQIAALIAGYIDIILRKVCGLFINLD